MRGPIFIRHGFAWYVWHAIAGVITVMCRFAFGFHLDGQPRTNAGWVTPGDAATKMEYRVTRWTAMPILKRAAIRWGVTITALAVLYGSVAAPTLTRVSLVSMATLGLVYVSWRVYGAYRERDWRRRYILPIGESVGSMLGLQTGGAREVEQWLTIPRDVRDEEARGELRLYISPRVAYDEKVLKSAEKLIAGKLAIAHADMEWQWSMVGERPHLTARRRQSAPTLVELADIRHMITAEDDGKMPLGLGIARREISPSLAIESPHIGFSCQSGTGKSETTKVMIAVCLHKGYDVGIIDVKIESQMWVRDVPGVRYSDSGKAAFWHLISAAEEMKRRQEVIRDTPRDEVADIGNRMVLFFEEQNIGMAAIDAYWQEIKNEPEWKGKKNPAVAALFGLSCAGRSVKMHLVSIAQYFDVPSTCAGKPAIRQNYGIMMIRGTHQAWDMLAKHVKPYPRKPKDKQKGRMHIILDNEPVEFQSAIFTDDEALELASTGRGVTVPTQWTSGTDLPGGRVTEDSVTRYSLIEAAKAGFVGDNNVEWLRQRKRRWIAAGNQFPEGTKVGGMIKYTETEIRDWYTELSLSELVSPQANRDNDNEE